MNDLQLQTDPFKNIVLSFMNLNLTFFQNKEKVRITKTKLREWINNENDRIFFQNKEEVNSFYDSIHLLICDFEMEQDKCENSIVLIVQKMSLLLYTLYPNYIETINKYFETTREMSQNVTFVNNLPSIQHPSIEDRKFFFDRYNDICNEFLNVTNNYNNKVVEIDKLKTLNHNKILENSFIQKILKNDKSSLRNIFNRIEINKISLINIANKNI